MRFVGTGKKLTARDYATVAATINIKVPTLQGVIDVEAAGSGFDSKNRPKILPEPHVFYARLGAGPARDKAVKLGVAYPKWGTKPYPKTSEANYQRLAMMMTIDEKKAVESTSWGLTQVMGYNCKDAGYADVYKMIEAYLTGEAEQLAAFVRLIDKWDLEDELQRRDARGFALKYNGKGFDKNHYDTRLRTAWEHRDAGTLVQKLVDTVPTEARGPAPALDPAVLPVVAPSNPITENLPAHTEQSAVQKFKTGEHL